MYARAQERMFIISGIFIMCISLMVAAGVILDAYSTFTVQQHLTESIGTVLGGSVLGLVFILYGSVFLRTDRILRKCPEEAFAQKLHHFKDWELLRMEHKTAAVGIYSAKRELVFNELHRRGLVDESQLREQTYEKLLYLKQFPAISPIRISIRNEGLVVAPHFLWISWVENHRHDAVIRIRDIEKVQCRSHRQRNAWAFKSFSGLMTGFRFTVRGRKRPITIWINDRQVALLIGILKKLGVDVLQ